MKGYVRPMSRVPIIWLLRAARIKAVVKALSLESTHNEAKTCVTVGLSSNANSDVNDMDGKKPRMQYGFLKGKSQE